MTNETTTPEEFNALVATNIRMQRAAKQMNLRELAEATNFSAATISRLESGERDISVGQVVRIAQGLGVDPKVLLYGAIS